MAEKRVPLLYIKPGREDGLVIIYQYIYDGEKPYYDAFWKPDYDDVLRLGEGTFFSCNLGTTLNRVFDFCEGEYKIMNFFDEIGELEVYIKKEDDQLPIVQIKKINDDYRPIKAKDVPKGASLSYDAAGFFRFLKGPDSVKDGILQQ